MAINSTTRITTAYTSGNNFVFAFKVYKEEDVKVIQVNTTTKAETVLTLTTNYTVTLNDDQNDNPGGTVTLVSNGNPQNLGSGLNIVITSQVSALQQTEITNQGGFYPEVANDVFDKGVILHQQQQQILDKTIRFPLTQNVGGLQPTENAAERANKTCVFDANGDFMISGLVDGRDISADGAKLDTIEVGATADQTAAEIRQLVEDATDSNVFTDADHSKLNGIEDNATRDQTAAEIRTLVDQATDSNVFTDGDHTKLDGIEPNATADQTISEIKSLIAGSPLDSSHLAPNSVTISEIEDAELSTLAGMQSGTASKLADSTALTADIADLNQLDGLTKQTTITDTDASFPTSGAVVDYIAAQIAPIGGLEVIATDQDFPNTMPASGVVISIADAGGVVVSPSGVSTTARTKGGATVTINGINSAFANSTVDDGVAFMVSSTGANNVYDFHKATLREADILSISGTINDFAERYRVGAINPVNDLDEGDLFYNTATNKFFVYNGTIWDEVQSVGNFYISGFNEAIDGNRQDFTINNAPADAQQLLVSINGVIQKPNSGNNTPSEGFALAGNIVKLASPPPQGSNVFVTVMGSTVDIGTPSANTVTSAILQNGSVQTAKLADQAVTLDKLLHGDANSDGKFLRANNGADPSFETIDLTNLSGSSLTSGTIPAARFGADTIATGSLAAGALPTDVTISDANISGNLTIESADIVNGTIVDADISGSAAIALSKLATGALPTGITVTSANISDLSIVDADINASAAIALTKLATGALPTGITIASANLVDGTIVDADINASAAIANSKLADSGVSAGTVGSSTAIPILTVNAKGIITATSTTAIDSTTIANGSSSVSVANNGAITSNANHDFSAGIDVTGNITVSGTVDGVDIAALNTTVSNLSLSGNTLADGTTATTQAANDATTKIATTAFVGQAVTNLIDSSPSALNTLNELAAALGDDANFSTTVTNSIATKLPLAGGQITGNITCSGSQTFDGRDLSVDGAKLDGIEAGATGDQTASEILTLLKTVDGSGSGLDADTLDGLNLSSSASSNTVVQRNSSGYIYANYINTTDNAVTSAVSGLICKQSGNGDFHRTANAASVRTFLNVENGATGDQTAAEIRALVNAAVDSNVFTNALKNKLDGIAAGATNVTNTNQLTNGAGFITSADGGNAATLDGIDSSQFIRSDTDDSIAAAHQIRYNSSSAINTSTAYQAALEVYGGNGAGTDAFMSFHVSGDFALYFGLDGGLNDLAVGGWSMGAAAYRVWHAGNDGSGSGLDADTLDGIQASSFLRSDTADTATGKLTTRDIQLSAGYHLQRSNHHSGHLEGGYNNVGANSTKTNPIFSIGSSYNPNDDTLSNMYGVGFTHGNASFTPSGASWGLYVASAGTSRVFLDGGHGRVYIGTNNNYITNYVSGDYGSFQINGSGANSWEGFSIDGRMVFMHDGGNEVGIYNDVDNQWMLRAYRNSSLYLYHAGSAKLQTTSSGIDVTGRIDINDSNTRVHEGTSNTVRLQSNSGYVDVGPQNSGYCHFTTDRDKFYFNRKIQIDGNCEPYGSHDLGASGNRWQNLYVNDLQLSNESSGGNSVDGTWGDWTLQEGEDTIFMLNNRNGKKYKMNLTEVN